MQASQEHSSSGSIRRLFHKPMQQLEPYYSPHFQILDNSVCADNCVQSPDSFQAYREQFFTLESAPAPYVGYNSPSAVSLSSYGSPFSTQCSRSYVSDQNQSPECVNGSPLSGCSVVDDANNFRRRFLRDLENQLLGPECDMEDSSRYAFHGNGPVLSTLPSWKQVLELAPSLELKQVLLACAEAVSESDFTTARCLMDVLEHRVSISGEPMERLSAYMLEGIRARLLSSGSIIYKKLKCKEPTSSELMSYMHVLYQICPYYKFAYRSSNVVIEEAMVNEPRIHIIDFQIAQGSQWMGLIQVLAQRPGGPPFIRLTGVDDSQSAHARGGGLQLVGERLSKFAESFGVPFEFHGAAMSGCKVEFEDLRIRPGEALAVNFPYMLHHMPDESVSTANHRDRLLRLVKGLSPKVVTLVEQESNTNTAPFFPRFRETLDYYTAMFESIDIACSRDDRQRINTEEHCVARDIVNIIACEGEERVERHEPFGKWKSRLMMAGFTQIPLSTSVSNAIKDLLKEFNPNYRHWDRDGALYLGWKQRVMATSSAWR